MLHLILDFEPISSNEKSQLEDSELHEEAFSDNTMEIDKKDVKPKIKPENERSSSPWTEEEDNSNRPSKRRCEKLHLIFLLYLLLNKFIKYKIHFF